MDKPKVYLSSPIITLEDLRSEIIPYFENKKNFKVVSYGDICKGRLSGELRIVDECLNEVRKSNGLILIVARRYGEPKYKSNGKEVSLTELEYLEAVKHDIKRFIFCREEVWNVYQVWEKNRKNINSFDWDPRYDYPEKLMHFVSKLYKEEKYIDRFRDVKELKNRLSNIEFVFGVLKDKPKITSADEEMEVSVHE